MQSNIWITIILVVSFVISFHHGANAQKADEKCRQIVYSPHKKGARPYPVRRIEGQALFAFVSQKEEMSVGGICLVLFSEKDKKPVAATTTNDNGQFEFADVAPGAYTLIASAADEELQKIVLAIRLYAAKEKGSGAQGILFHLRSKEDRRNSYAAPITNPALREELLQMFKQDQSIRDEMIAKGIDYPDQATREKMRSIDAANLSRLKVILQKYGCPGPGLVGPDGSEAAFYIVQHADYTFQKKTLPQISKECLAGRLSWSKYALLLDRTLVGEGKPQIYGTQAKPFEYWNGKEPVLYPIKDEADVDKRRAKLHLSPLSEYREWLKKKYFPQIQNK
jgi:hypothetical protein